jgi:hypothetical protein
VALGRVVKRMRHDHQNAGSDRRALVRFGLSPGQRLATIGVPPLVEGLASDALIAGKTLDSDATIAETDRARRLMHAEIYSGPRTDQSFATMVKLAASMISFS